MIKEIPGKGRGLVTTKLINAGELILKETAAFVLDIETFNDHLINETLKKLDDNTRKQFRNLRAKENSNNENEPSGDKDIFYNNAIHMDGDSYGIFLNISLVNHSCMPNAVWGSCDPTDTLELRAMQTISQGTEITVNYIMDKSFLLDALERKVLLVETWGFSCSCPPCSEDRDGPVRYLLRELQKRMREKLCLAKFEDLYKLHVQKLSAVKKMKAYNHQEMLNCHQVHLVLAVFSGQSPADVSSQVSSWRDLCSSDGLLESSIAWQDMDRSFSQGVVNNREEFFLPGEDKVRTEWIEWVYRKL